MKYIKTFSLEITFWTLALVLLATANSHDHHFTLCPLANLGLSWCPGCGLGRSITALMHGDVKESFSHHWFGIPALMIIVYRIYQLSYQAINNNKEKGLI